MRFYFLLPVIFLFVTSCSSDGDGGCTDSSATNFDPNATSDDGSCEYDMITNGCPSELPFDGYTYDIVEIGDQCWFAENLQSTAFMNGGDIDEITDDAEWSEYDSPAQCIYENEPANLATYGRLYNGYAVTGELALCPEGWHIPSTEDWEELEVFIGVPVEDIGTLATWLGEEEGAGASLKATSGWSNGGSGTDVHGFSGMPGGSRFYSDGSFFSGGDHALWWTTSTISTALSEHLFHRSLWNQQDGILQAHVPMEVGASIRCLQD